ncbi:MAG TPA: fumarylacetoacetate hydrolase family protein [Myxococcota bacterium]|nr:fumarylacetoacetate hydrolase family protein [Myxococcota bacterium]
MPLGSSEVEAAAALLVAAHRALQPRPALPKACHPADLLDAYAIQQRFVALLGRPVGYKIGYTNPQLQRALGVPGPVYGRLLAGRVHASPAKLAASGFATRVVETEFGVRMARALPASGAPYSADAVAAAVDAVMPSFEIVDSRFENWRKLTPLEAIADNVLHSHWVHGVETSDFRALDLAGVEAVSRVDGREVTRGRGANVLGSPLESLRWLANELAQRGGGLAAGDLVTTGCCTDLFEVAPGGVAEADFGPLGRVRVEFPP